MIVCICKAINDGQIRNAIATGAGSVEAIEEACGAGSCCGACRDHIGAMINDFGSEPPAAAQLIQLNMPKKSAI